MNYSDVFKRQSFIILSSIIVISLIIIGTSFAIFADRDESGTQTLKAGTLRATFTAASGSSQITDALVPLSDADAGSGAKTYTFNLNNTGSLPMAYTITITNTGNLPNKYIKVSYDNDEAKYLDKLSKQSGSTDTDSVYILKTGDIADSTNESHTLKVWISDKDSGGVDTNTDIINKSINLKIGLSGTVAGSIQDNGGGTAWPGGTEGR